VIPTVLGMTTAHHWPAFAPAHPQFASACYRSLFFVLFVVGALVANWDFFMKYVERVDAVRLSAERICAAYRILDRESAALLPEADRRAVSLEVGIQNSGFGLVLVFNFFDGLGGMAIVAAWWGIWHLLVGMSLATWWRRHPPEVLAAGATA
jgi:bile acid:Na+ symporter, BASS family